MFKVISPCWACPSSCTPSRGTHTTSCSCAASAPRRGATPRPPSAPPRRTRPSRHERPRRVQRLLRRVHARGQLAPRGRPPPPPVVVVVAAAAAAAAAAVAEACRGRADSAGGAVPPSAAPGVGRSPVASSAAESAAQSVAAIGRRLARGSVGVGAPGRRPRRASRATTTAGLGAEPTPTRCRASSRSLCCSGRTSCAAPPRTWSAGARLGRRQRLERRRLQGQQPRQLAHGGAFFGSSRRRWPRWRQAASPCDRHSQDVSDGVAAGLQDTALLHAPLGGTRRLRASSTRCSRRRQGCAPSATPG